jgi:hypothetical protein
MGLCHVSLFYIILRKNSAFIYIYEHLKKQMKKKKKNLINIQMKNYSTTNFTNKMKTYLDFNQKYKNTKESYLYH